MRKSLQYVLGSCVIAATALAFQNCGKFADAANSSLDGFSVPYVFQNTWTPIPGGRNFNAADSAVVWTGNKMVIWGGYFGVATNEGLIYDPAADTWAQISTNGAPSPRSLPSIVQTQGKLIVWGGWDPTGAKNLGDGGIYDIATDTWTAMSMTGAPGPRSLHSAVATSNRMIIWGGSNGVVLGDGAIFDPLANSWSPISMTGAPEARSMMTTLWTGSTMVVWGGTNGTQPLATGAVYSPATNTWTAIATTGAPAGRFGATAEWTGNRMIIWGGAANAGALSGSVEAQHSNVLGDGAIWSANSNTWSALTTAGAPAARSLASSAWTGTEMLVWGGYNGTTQLGNGAAYNPNNNTWRTLPAANAPLARDQQASVWTGVKMIIWGGANSAQTMGDGATYDPFLNMWSSEVIAPKVRYQHSSLWTGQQVLFWGGSPDNASDYNDGLLFDPNSRSWSTISLVNAPSARDSHAAVWTGTQMIVWGGYDNRAQTFASGGGIYNSGADSWSPVSTAGQPSLRESPLAFWTGAEMLVWGGDDGSIPVATGGLFSPYTNSWRAISTVNAPSPRWMTSAVWTGSKLIVWGGFDQAAQAPVANGSIYDPVSNSWKAIATAGAPSARDGHTAVWTGSKMIVWGGYSSIAQAEANDGAMYDPITDSWSPMQTASVIAARDSHSAVWTGTQMVVWGGEDINNLIHNDGGIYDLATDTWTAISTAGAPSYRMGASLTWAGSGTIVFGGHVGATTLGDGAILH